MGPKNFDNFAQKLDCGVLPFCSVKRSEERTMFREKKPPRGQSQIGLVQMNGLFEIFLYKYNRVKYF